MKKTFYFAAVALAAMSIASCSGSQKSGEVKEDVRAQKEVYSGILPSADTDGIKYTLKLDYSNDSTFNSGVYDLDETYLKADSTSASGYKDLESFKTKGDFTVMQGEGANAGKSFLKLVEEKKSETDTVAPAPIYFLVESDSTIVMVNADLEPAVNSGLNYTLKLEK